MPKSIPKHHFESRVFDATTSEDSRNLVRMWYALDENSISTDNSSGLYVLRNLDESEKDYYWKDVYPKLLELLSGLPFDVENHDLFINRSVTEYELKMALRRECDRDRVLWFYRKFSGGINQSDETFGDYDDTLQSIDKKKYYYELIEWMQEKIPSDRVRTYDQCSYASYKNNDYQWAQQFDKWRQEVREVLNSSLQNIIRQRSAWDKDGLGLGGLDLI